MGTSKRQRQKANRALKHAEQAREARTDAVKRNVVRWIVIGVLAIAAVVLIVWVSGGFDDEETPSTTVPLTLPATLPATLPITDVTTVPAETSETAPVSSAPSSTVPAVTTTAP